MSRIGLIRQGFFNPSLKASHPPPFSFIDDFNLNQLRFEFSSLYSLFIANQSLMKNHQEVVFYLDYLSQMLMDYYTVDYVADELEKIRLKKQTITRFIQDDFVLEKTPEDPEIRGDQSPLSPWLTLKKTTVSVGKTVKSSARVRSYVARLIAARSYWNTSRSLANQVIRLAVASGVSAEFMRFNQALGVYCGVSEVMQVLDQMQGVLRVSSVALNGLRLLINTSTFLKHLIHAASNDNLSLKKVFLQEIEKRIYTLMDDSMWTSVNFINNYRELVNLSAPAAARLSLIFLGMDAVMLLVSWLIEMKNYCQRLQELKSKKKEEITAWEAALIHRQINLLADEWQVQCDYHVFNLVAAILLCTVFAMTLLTVNPVLLGALALLSMVGNAMYNSANEFKQYRQAASRVTREKSNRLSGLKGIQPLLELTARQDEAFAVFLDSFLFNVVFTASLIAAAAVSLPLAGMMVLCYAGYKLTQACGEKTSQAESAVSPECVYRLSMDFH
ncbi:hypothetical protein DIZ81_05005 [Legionella taurinensis]|uniref:Coiled-coil protein n=1 Tax=Legionella taurinensis TaxID=70611 RepID=A0AB38N5S2_9GAMM|nr:hypothetical protein [Legionella taurinensis]MDX1837033.1 hypothetical protein [Legionella taurinensis]PUT41437.1 hypothetical protein DB744_05005 [Legionella taurinensis]PUT42676.1 hypothetical protein DB746_07340 [Legionella taurinensis]PUT46704.1 hypothetical protein DB743_04740 [Legionella taurinensis]PUT47353.1 hypothetical protein DB745_08420 [Legionella taurinensis]